MKKSPGDEPPQKERKGRDARHFIDPGQMTLTVKVMCKTGKRENQIKTIPATSRQSSKVPGAHGRCASSTKFKTWFDNARSQSRTVLAGSMPFSQVIGYYLGIRYSREG